MEVLHFAGKAYEFSEDEKKFLVTELVIAVNENLAQNNSKAAKEYQTLSARYKNTPDLYEIKSYISDENKNKYITFALADGNIDSLIDTSKKNKICFRSPLQKTFTCISENFETAKKQLPEQLRQRLLPETDDDFKLFQGIVPVEFFERIFRSLRFEEEDLKNALKQNVKMDARSTAGIDFWYKQFVFFANKLDLFNQYNIDEFMFAKLDYDLQGKFLYLVMNYGENVVDGMIQIFNCPDLSDEEKINFVKEVYDRIEEDKTTNTFRETVWPSYSIVQGKINEVVQDNARLYTTLGKIFVDGFVGVQNSCPEYEPEDYKTACEIFLTKAHMLIDNYEDNSPPVFTSREDELRLIAEDLKIRHDQFSRSLESYEIKLQTAIQPKWYWPFKKTPLQKIQAWQQAAQKIFDDIHSNTSTNDRHLHRKALDIAMTHTTKKMFREILLESTESRWWQRKKTTEEKLAAVLQTYSDIVVHLEGENLETLRAIKDDIVRDLDKDLLGEEIEKIDTTNSDRVSALRNAIETSSQTLESKQSLLAKLETAAEKYSTLVPEEIPENSSSSIDEMSSH